ncbi:MAG TPA: cysteine desulfurase family protein [Actinomycetota bacterium]|nr:cysteine desulfurase family protein [Actinomycetota bacterium]
MGTFPMVTTSTYLDHASATPLDERARVALLAALDEFADPLRVHGDGLAAKRLLDDARATVAGALGAQPDEIVFTSGGTESVALAIWGGVRPVRELGTRIVTTTVEHPAVGGVLHTLETDGFESVLVEVDRNGSIDLDAFAAAIRRPGTLLASVHHANHEVGTIQPIAECARVCREAGVLFHTDACQTVGHLPVDAPALGVDLLSISGHKFGGPPGIGALYVRRGVPIAAYPCGDDRERRRRSGVENVPGVAAMAAALETRLEGMNDEVARGWALTDTIRAGIAERVEGASVHGHATQRVPHLVCFSVPDLDAEIMSMALDDRGFRIAAGSNCSGAAGEASSVLEHMGVASTASFRIGVGPDTTEDDADRLLATLPSLVSDLREVRAAGDAAMARFRSSGERRPKGPASG